MQRSQIGELRRFKLAQYGTFLPPGTLPSVGRDWADDTDYAAALRDIAAVAPAGLGLAVALQRSVADLSTLGHATLSCATLREVFDLWTIYGASAGEPVHLDAALSAAVHEDGTRAETWTIAIKPFGYLPRAVCEMLVDELCCVFFVFAKELTGRDFSDFSVSLPHPRRAGVDYDAAFPGAIRFDQAIASVAGPSAALDAEVLPHDAVPHDLLIGHDPERAAISPITLRLYEFFLRCRSEPPTLDNAALTLRLSRRTLVRRLADEDTSYGRVLDGFRRHYALILARDSGLKAKQIAHLVGFRSENSLRRSFKQWTGRPIGSWCADPLRRD